MLFRQIYDGKLTFQTLEILEPMINPKLFSELSAKLSGLVPIAEELRSELRAKIEQQLKNSFKDLGLLSREEFEVKSKSLERAEARIIELEKVIGDLETRVHGFEKKK